MAVDSHVVKGNAVPLSRTTLWESEQSYPLYKMCIYNVR